ncbi:MAG: DUF4364 family protein [Oscillospiraceae bacterium]
MEFDAFDAGIELGGLRNRDEIRLLVCYLLKTLDKPFAKLTLVDSMLENGLANYFEINQAIGELLKNGSIDNDIEDEEEVLKITERGREMAEMLETSLPKSVREKAVNSAIRMMTIAKRERENKIEVEKLENGSYKATFILEGETVELMRLSIYVADSMQLEMVKKNYLNDPVKLYSSIITALTI